MKATSNVSFNACLLIFLHTSYELIQQGTRATRQIRGLSPAAHDAAAAHEGQPLMAIFERLGFVRMCPAKTKRKS